MEKNLANKQKMVELLNKIDQKKKELKLLKKEYKDALNSISSSWKEEVSKLFPQLSSCNVGEYVGVDITIKGKVYNIFISDYRQKLYCMFCLDRKDVNNNNQRIWEVMDEDEIEKLKQVFYDYLDNHNKYVYSNISGYYVKFDQDQYNVVYQCFLDVVKTFV